MNLVAPHGTAMTPRIQRRYTRAAGAVHRAPCRGWWLVRLCVESPCGFSYGAAAGAARARPGPAREDRPAAMPPHEKKDV